MYAFQPSIALDKESGEMEQLREKGWNYFRVFCAPAAGGT